MGLTGEGKRLTLRSFWEYPIRIGQDGQVERLCKGGAQGVRRIDWLAGSIEGLVLLTDEMLSL